MGKSHIIASIQPSWFTDSPVTQPVMAAYLGRRCCKCISLREALQAHTINAAYQAHLEDVTGSIEEGKSAELVVLDSDSEAIPAKQIQDIRVLETVFKGETVFSAAAPDNNI